MNDSDDFNFSFDNEIINEKMINKSKNFEKEVLLSKLKNIINYINLLTEKYHIAKKYYMNKIYKFWYIIREFDHPVPEFDPTFDPHNFDPHNFDAHIPEELQCLKELQYFFTKVQKEISKSKDENELNTLINEYREKINKSCKLIYQIGDEKMTEEIKSEQELYKEKMEEEFDSIMQLFHEKQTCLKELIKNNIKYINYIEKFIDHAEINFTNIVQFIKKINIHKEFFLDKLIDIENYVGHINTYTYCNIIKEEHIKKILNLWEICKKMQEKIFKENIYKEHIFEDILEIHVSTYVDTEILLAIQLFLRKIKEKIKKYEINKKIFDTINELWDITYQ